MVAGRTVQSAALQSQPVVGIGQTIFNVEPQLQEHIFNQQGLRTENLSMFRVTILNPIFILACCPD